MLSRSRWGEVLRGGKTCRVWRGRECRDSRRWVRYRATRARRLAGLELAVPYGQNSDILGGHEMLSTSAFGCTAGWGHTPVGCGFSASLACVSQMDTLVSSSREAAAGSPARNRKWILFFLFHHATSRAPRSEQRDSMGQGRTLQVPKQQLQYIEMERGGLSLHQLRRRGEFSL
ncbi:hypothetical protein KIL84_018022 [Mauremys mutica]|uniref:Uncharacterized protein n=1 Tax=Mauremys mutica TaxID=74926 RepID=A0A9D3XTW3_9SAUR|nr:hypothetical protein KIL84_018022 [Mauremys mutica]